MFAFQASQVPTAAILIARTTAPATVHAMHALAFASAVQATKAKTAASITAPRRI